MNAASSAAPALNLASALADCRQLLPDRPERAAEKAREVLAGAPECAEAYRLLGTALRLLGDDDGATEAELSAISASVRDPELISAASALVDNDLPLAESILRPVLKRRPTDVAAIRMMAELAARIGRLGDAENLLRRALELAPAFTAARANLATVLYKQQRPAEALEELDRITAQGESDLAHSSLRAAAVGRLGGHEEAIALYRQVLERHPGDPRIWMSVGHNLRTLGRVDEAIAAYRKGAELRPEFGEIWWSLANLKTFRFSDREVDAMRQALAHEGLTPENEVHLNFALGKAMEDRAQWAKSFAHYETANRERRTALDYDPGEIERQVDRSISVLTPEFFAERKGFGCPSPDPIFIVGLPRAGSTLVEQILSSHPKVEGTTEHPDIPMISRRLAGAEGEKGTRRYPAFLESLTADQCRALGEEYLQRIAPQRVTDRPFFIDKLPNNWAFLGLIKLILPNAKIVDARRHPLACGFSNFKQHFARGQPFTYDLSDIGNYYRQYVRMMRHIDEVLPGWVTRIVNEDLVADPEGEIRRLVASLGLEWDDACLAHHETRRPIRTPSAEQVRQPINASGTEQWRHYEPWLGPLADALGDTVADWRR
ncbi:MAG TPA: sulfotransferase [Sphingomicrobium sp.]|jgi:tetratricopeptide (TPR) repeat protein